MLYGAVRLMLTYRGAFMWHMNAGMGETIMTPIYLALKNRGVKFEFFHKVTNLGLSDDQKRIERVDIDVQATIKPEYRNGYYPLFIASDNIPCWPTEPFWEQLVEGEAIQKASNHDLESWWNNAPIAGKKTLQRGQDFDLVVLGISLGAFQYICAELIAARQDSWAPMVNNVATVRTQGLQLWLHKTAQELGWAGATPVLTRYREPFDTWSDMSHLIPHEHWPPQDNVQQIAYFCNAMPTPKNTPPFSESGYPQEEWRSVLENAREFVGEWLGPIWPKLGNPNQPGKFDWSLLVNPGGGADPLAAQFVRANIDPTELYVLSLPKTAQYRLASGDSRFENLYLAGDWTFTDLNVGCIEATVISGRMASQAICGWPNHIYGSFGYVIPIARRATA
jgi:uncharacterized protein with NAD-binding domain and iron-sulfur cluster